MPAPSETQDSPTGPDWGLGTVDRLPDYGPRYVETPADPYAPGAPFPAEPFNAATAALFVVIVGVWAWRLRGRYRAYPFVASCLPVLLAGGVGGTLYHATRTSRVFFFLDVVPILLLGLAGAVYLTVRLAPRRAWVNILGLIGVYVAVQGFMWGVLPKDVFKAWRINVSYAALAAMVVVPLAVVLVRTRFRHGGWVVVGLLSFAVAWFFRLLDRDVGVYLPMGSHWLWHTFGAVSTAGLVEYFYRLEGERGGVGVDGGDG